jgi:hypothetical protein
MRLNKLQKFSFILSLIVAFALVYSCNKQEQFYETKAVKRTQKKTVDKDVDSANYKIGTQNVIVIVVDGARYTDTWGALGTPLIPQRKELSAQGALCANFYNYGLTLTVSGHTAIATGVYELLNNVGAETPTYANYMQVWRKQFNQPAEKAWIIASKDKVDVIKNCTDPKWKNTYMPNTNCGKSGLGSGYRDDFTTLNVAKQILDTYSPNLMLINFKQPDSNGHTGDSLAYVQGIIDSDNYVKQLWDFIQSHKHYKDNTAFIVTNDHGRHTPGHLDGFISHGDDCLGCRHIELLAIGPDFKKNYISTTAYSQTDIAPTIAYLLGFKMPVNKGRVMTDLLIK